MSEQDDEKLKRVLKDTFGDESTEVELEPGVHVVEGAAAEALMRKLTGGMRAGPSEPEERHYLPPELSELQDKYRTASTEYEFLVQRLTVELRKDASQLAETHRKLWDEISKQLGLDMNRGWHLHKDDRGWYAVNAAGCSYMDD